jgi:hypothetical protein
MARNTTFKDRSVIVARSGTGVIAADSATLTDANIDPSLMLDCGGLDTIFVGAEITAGTNPTMTVEPLFRDAEAADGSRWFRLMTGALEGVTLASAANQNTGALATNANFVELRVFGQKVFFRVTAVANATSTNGWKILVMPGRLRPVFRGMR